MSELKKTLAEVESERLTRRAALRKFGFGAGMAAFMALSVDDLARIVAKKLERNAADNKFADSIAHELRNSGVAFAEEPSPTSCKGVFPLSACTECCINSCKDLSRVPDGGPNNSSPYGRCLTACSKGSCGPNVIDDPQPVDPDPGPVDPT